MTCDESDEWGGTGSERTTAEQRILDVIAESRGEEYATENAELILAQARLVGEL